MTPRNRSRAPSGANIRTSSGVPAGERATIHNGGEDMQCGMIGLGRMGANMARRLMRGGHEVVVTNRSPEPIARKRQS